MLKSHAQWTDMSRLKTFECQCVGGSNPSTMSLSKQMLLFRPWIEPDILRYTQHRHGSTGQQLATAGKTAIIVVLWRRLLMIFIVKIRKAWQQLTSRCCVISFSCWVRRSSSRPASSRWRSSCLQNHTTQGHPYHQRTHLAQHNFVGRNNISNKF